MPKVSIIIPVYNVEKYLAECLDSVIGQTLRDIEIICIDDGSTDRSPQILDEYAKKDSRIIIIHQKNAGPGLARNVGINLAKGQYIAFLDSDDAMYPTLCEKTSQVADSQNADMTYFLYDTNHFFRKSKFEYFLLKGKSDKLTTNEFLLNIQVWSKLWRTNFIRSKQIKFPDDFFGMEDHVFNWHAISQDPVIAFVPERLLMYRVTPDSLTLDGGKRGYIRPVVVVYDRIKRNLIQIGKYEGQWKNLFLATKLRNLKFYYHQVPKEIQPALLNEIYLSLSEEERQFLKETHDLPWYIKDFYAALDGSQIAKIKCTINSILQTARNIIRLPLLKIRNLCLRCLRKTHGRTKKIKILMIGSRQGKNVPTGGAFELVELTIKLLQKQENIEVIPISTTRPCNNSVYRIISSLNTLVSILGKISKCDIVLIFLDPSSLSIILRILLPITKFWKKPLIVKTFGGIAHNEDYRLPPFTPLPPKIANIRTNLLKQTDLYLPETKHGYLAAHKEGIKTIWLPNYRVLPEQKDINVFSNSNTTEFHGVFIGRVDPVKGINEIIQADPLYHEKIRIDVYGPMSNEILEQDFESLKHVKYCGVLKSSEVTNILKQYQAFIFPSYHPGEGHPGSLIEALGAGLPIITTNKPFIYEVITENEGIIIPAKNAEELAKAINRLAEDEPLRQRLSENALQRSRLFDANVLIPFLADCCRKITLGEPLPEPTYIEIE
jgi:glycosyltransferase involved in cell wall biosynthesis